MQTEQIREGQPQNTLASVLLVQTQLSKHSQSMPTQSNTSKHTLRGAGETISRLSNANVDHQLLDEQLTHGVSELLLLLDRDGGGRGGLIGYSKENLKVSNTAAEQRLKGRGQAPEHNNARFSNLHNARPLVDHQ